MADVTQILNAIERGDPQAAEELLPLVYEELRCLAAQKLSHESPGQTLQATALVHEAYIRLVEGTCQNWNSRGHFFKAAAEAMRRILVENARRKKSKKYGGNSRRVALEVSELAVEGFSDDIIALDEALTKLTNHKPHVAEVVKLRYFAGLTISQVTEILGIPGRTIDSYWAYARAWLFREINRYNQERA